MTICMADYTRCSRFRRPTATCHAQRTWCVDEHLITSNINVRLRSFDLLPFLHGKLFADGTIFFHSAQWDRAGRLSYPNTFHEIISEKAMSSCAIAYRGLFGNWIRKYDRSVHEEIFTSANYDWSSIESEMNHRLENLDG